MTPISNVIVLGGGSAGFMAALTLKLKVPNLNVRVIHSSDLGIIGVGEGSTAALTRFLHEYLAVAPAKFFEIARPTWKLGLKFVWGPRESFHYTFGSGLASYAPGLTRPVGYFCDEDMTFQDLHGGLMTADRAFERSPQGGPVLTPAVSYHFENEKFNPSVGNEESLVHNGRRGGPDGTNDSFNYGNDNHWGAHGAWGPADMGWDGTPATGAGGGDAAPPAGQWQHLIYTYNSGAAAVGHQRVYSNGLLENSENANLNTHAGSPIRVAAQQNHDNPGEHLLGFNGSIARVRISDTPVSARDVALAYNAQAGQFGQAARPTANSPLPRNRYEFNGNANDSVGGAHGQVLSLGSPPAAPGYSGGQLNLGNSGTDAANGNFVELPDNVLDGLSGAATLEFWGTWAGGNQWQRSVDLGQDTSQYAFVAPSSDAGGSEGLANAFEFKDESGGPFTGIRRVETGQTPLGQEVQFVAVFDPSTNEARYYVDGTLVNTVGLDGFNLDNLGDDNNWLGRSKFGGDPLLSGSINEFRIYDGALSSDQVFGNFLAGPDNLNVPEPGALGLLGMAGGLMLRRRRRP